ncbi:discoidin domain-containing protein [uncultured Nocardioides sp.]|jgi:hypothetical protein|uniref:discoidin domain-containing protein n=1 Tax=uncultured Nocardioides sp. TaxID=198441 RepID=UPI000C6A05EF|nr:discoidin domain-containing protein [uncultured Nocardioides sp.]MAO82116.1 hypothetical protein [Nocardioides sp.]
MSTCARCGAEHPVDSVGRYCTNCGAPRDAAPGPGQEPPPVHQAPPPPRFPLYADEPVDPVGPVAPVPVPAPAPGAPGAPGARHRRRTPLVWVGLGVAALLLVVVAVALLTGESVTDPGAPGPAAGTSSTGGDPAPTADPEPLVDLVTAEAPRSDADSVDISTGRPTSYEAGNMVDGDPETAWRVDGDASGETLRFTFDEPVTLTSVGLVNGYAKTSVDGSGAEFDLYAGGRRVLQVQWVLDGEAVIDQALSDGDRELQRVDTGAVEVTVVELRLLEVSAPGKGPAARDKTAVSEVSLEGYAG